MIGSSWATWFSSKGLPTRMYDIDPEVCRRGAQWACDNLRTMVELEFFPPSELAAALSNVQPVATLDAVLMDCDYVQESVLEDYQTKAEVYRSLERHLSPNAIIASSSSGLLMTKMQQALKHPERSLIAHPFNPPHLVPLVELVPGEFSSPETVAVVKAFFQQHGKRPVVLNKEVPGHIANRLAAAVWREALALLDDDVASLEDIDAALCTGPGMRWALMGQHLIYELGGGQQGYQGFFDGIGRSFSSYWQDMQTWTEIPESVRVKAIAGTESLLKERTRDEWARWRDEKLVRLLQILED
ncbi:MAG: 3-hydroxyacyl-CoA dehydrogenase family protein [Planctomycetaceae bacterium]|nr:3-hydroxyacyl-CoA dehydrogenase family protein [Planctomycetaceae bacterium]